MAIKTIGELVDALAAFSRSTPLVLLLRTPLDPASEALLEPLRVSARRDGVDVVCREVASQRLPVFREDHHAGVNADRWDSGDVVETSARRRVLINMQMSGLRG